MVNDAEHRLQQYVFFFFLLTLAWFSYVLLHVGMWKFFNSRDFDADENVFALASMLRILTAMFFI